MPALRVLGGEPDSYTGIEFFPDSARELCDDTSVGNVCNLYSGFHLSVNLKLVQSFLQKSQ